MAAYFAFRILQSGTLTVDDFKSYHELGRPRPRTLPFTDPNRHEGISVLESLPAAQAYAAQFPWLGTHVAELFIPDGAPVQRNQANRDGHFTIWGDPALIARYVRRVLAL